MTCKRLFRVLALTAFLAAALPPIAAPKMKEVVGGIVAKGTFTIVADKSLGSATLKPGNYQVIASDSQVSFLLKGKVVAQAPAEWRNTDRVDSNAIVDESGSIREIRFRGKKRSLSIM